MSEKMFGDFTRREFLNAAKGTAVAIAVGGLTGTGRAAME